MQNGDPFMARTILASHLAIFTAEGYEGDDIALDIIEFIARRMSEPEDAYVFELAMWVRKTLILYDMGETSFCETLSALLAAAMAAPVGTPALIEALH